MRELGIKSPALRNNFFLDKIPHDLLHAIPLIFKLIINLRSES